jgi:hypothetical protein
MRKICSWKTFAYVVLAVSFVAPPLCQAADDCVVIVNKANPAEAIGGQDLKKMFLGEKSTWSTGAKVSAATPPPDHPDYATVIKRTTGMSSGDFKRYFIQLSFLGKIVPPPRSLDSSAAVARFVATYPGAIGCVIASDAGASVKAVKIE